LEANTRDAIEKEFGVRYSVIFELPYYNVIRFITIDTMHNLFLGIAKCEYNDIWKDEGKLTKDHFNKYKNASDK